MGLEQSVNEVVICILFSADGLFVSSHERKYLGFKLLETLLPALTTSEVGVRLLSSSLTVMMMLHRVV